MRITLTVTAGPHQGKVFAFEGHDTFLVGRAPAAHFRLPREDRYFSRFHFLVECNAPASPLCPDCLAAAGKLPQPIAGYRLIRELGRGGMGVVHLAVGETDGSVVALKTVIPAVAGSRTQIEQFLREVNILRQLDHPN